MAVRRALARRHGEQLAALRHREVHAQRVLLAQLAVHEVRAAVEREPAAVAPGAVARVARLAAAAALAELAEDRHDVLAERDVRRQDRRAVRHADLRERDRGLADRRHRHLQRHRRGCRRAQLGDARRHVEVEDPPRARGLRRVRQRLEPRAEEVRPARPRAREHEARPRHARPGHAALVHRAREQHAAQVRRHRAERAREAGDEPVAHHRRAHAGHVLVSDEDRLAERGLVRRRRREELERRVVGHALDREGRIGHRGLGRWDEPRDRDRGGAIDRLPRLEVDDRAAHGARAADRLVGAIAIGGGEEAGRRGE